MAWVLFDNFRLKMMDGNALNFAAAGDTLKVSIHTVTYTPVQATDDFHDDATNEVTGTNYTAGGDTLASKTLVLASGTVTFDAADSSFLQSAGGFANGRHLILYDDTGVEATSKLIAFHTEGSDFGNVAGDLTLEYDANGLITSP